MRAPGLLAVLVGGFLLLPQCSLIISEDVANVRCGAEGHIGSPSCNPGEICALGRCRTCIEADACGDGIDNNCNNVTDETCSVAAGGTGAELTPDNGAPRG